MSPKSMSAASVQPFADSYSGLSSRSQPNRTFHSQTPGLDTLAEGSQYVLEQLQLARQARSSSNGPTNSDGKLPNDAHPPQSQYLQSYKEQNGPDFGMKDPSQPRDTLTEARSAIRKPSSATPVRRRISRACDQCNQLRTKCDGQQPCAHCLGNLPVSSCYNLVANGSQNLG